MPIEVTLSRWGNSLGFRVPKGAADTMGLKAGDVLSITVDQDQACFKKIHKRPVYSLDELLSQITDDNKHAEVDWGKPQGSEIW